MTVHIFVLVIKTSLAACTVTAAGTVFSLHWWRHDCWRITSVCLSVVCYGNSKQM